MTQEQAALLERVRKRRLGEKAPAGSAPFVGILSHGCSGDIYRVDYKVPAKDRPNPTIVQYTDGLLDIAMQALAQAKYRSDVDLAMVERRFTLNYRVPDLQRLAWAQRVVAAIGGGLATHTAEVYAG